MKYRNCTFSPHFAINNSCLCVIEEHIRNKYRYFIGYRVVKGGEVKYIHRSGYFDSKQKALDYLKGMDRF